MSSLVLALAVAGCAAASTGTSSGSSPKLPPVVFGSSALSRYSIPARYTCDGKDISPPLEWGSTPAGTGQVMVFALGFAPTRAQNYSISVEWAVAGINPDLHHLAAGEVPPGAFVGVNNSGKRAYSICPTRGLKERYQFMLYSIPTGYRISPEFDGIATLALISNRRAELPASGQGAFVAFYKRR